MPSEHEILEWMPDAVLLCDADGRIVFVNRQARVLTGYRRSELVGHPVELLVPTASRRHHVAHRRRFYARGETRSMGQPDSDFKLRRKDGSVVPVDIALGPVGTHTLAVVRDMTERREMEQALEHRALHDPLTDLANRTLFFDRLRQSIHSARRESSQAALVMLDLDGFKAVNDAFGHVTGDEILRQLSVRMSSGLRATDTAARIGGDEFALILPHITGRRAAQRMVRQRLAAVRRRIEVQRQKIRVGISAGIAMYPEDGRDADTLMRRADSAMYSAKHEGRDIVFYVLPGGAAVN